MQVGMFINTQFPEGERVADRLPELIEQVDIARESGFASLWFPHHFLTAPLQMLAITPMMAHLASAARGMTIGPNIMILPLLNPVQMAEEAATLDVLSGGNYILGAGLGYRAAEFDSFGIPLSERAPRFTEMVGLMRRLWTEDRVTHEGRFYTVRDQGISLKPTRPGGPPIWVAAQVDAAIRRAARIGDAWLIVNASALPAIVPQMRLYRAALAEFGRAASTFPIARECYVGTNHATAFAECRAALEYKYNSYAAWGMESPTKTMSFEDFAANRFIIGDKVSVAEEIARYREALGVDHFIMRVQWPGLPQDKVLHSIRRLGEIFA